MNKTLKIIIIVAVLISAILVTLKATGTIGDSTKGEEVEIQKSALATIVETVTASGKIQPETEVRISPEVSGEIIELPIKEGNKVSKGDLLVRINPDVYESSVKRAEASVKSAKAAMHQAEAQFVEAEKNYKRYEKLYKQNVISDAEWEGYQRAYTVADLSRESSASQYESAQATLKEAQDNLKRTTIVAPQDGTISSLNVELSERVVGTAQMAGTELLRVANLARMEVLVDVNENDIVKVTLGDTAEVEVDAYLNEKFLGVITEIANSANTAGVSSDQVTNFQVKVGILPSSYGHLLKDGMESPFRPGMTASVDIQTEVRRNVLSVPIRAVTLRKDTTANAKRFSSSDDKQEEYEVVFISNKGKADIRVVTTGVQDANNIEILSGLEEKENVIVGPYSAVSKKLMNQSAISATEAEETEDK